MSGSPSPVQLANLLTPGVELAGRMKRESVYFAGASSGSMDDTRRLKAAVNQHPW